MGKRSEEHVSERFARLLDLYRRPNGSEWGGQDLEDATGGAVKRAYVSLLKRGRIEHPGLGKLAAIAAAMGFPPGLWFADGEGFADGALSASLGDATVKAILQEILKMDRRDRERLLIVARQVAALGDGPDS